VVPAGRIFLHDLSMIVQLPHHRLPITLEAKQDLAWWQDFLPNWSGTSFILNTYWTPSSDMQLFTDASGSKVWGAFWNGCWLQSKWTAAQSVMPIVWKESHVGRDIFGQNKKNSISLWRSYHPYHCIILQQMACHRHLAKGLYTWYGDHVIGMHAILSCCTLPHQGQRNRSGRPGPKFLVSLKIMRNPQSTFLLGITCRL